METAITYLVYLIIAVVSIELILGLATLCFASLLFLFVGSTGIATVLALFKNPKRIK